MGERWEPFEAYSLESARTPRVKASARGLMWRVGLPAIPPADLARISVPTALIWGRHDLANRLSIAQAASVRYGWPLHVIENVADDPPRDRPDAFLRALGLALAR
jgi:pimeloyl-ACP methyl ester carboxylesterase